MNRLSTRVQRLEATRRTGSPVALVFATDEVSAAEAERQGLQAAGAQDLISAEVIVVPGGSGSSCEVVLIEDFDALLETIASHSSRIGVKGRTQTIEAGEA